MLRVNSSWDKSLRPVPSRKLFRGLIAGTRQSSCAPTLKNLTVYTLLQATSKFYDLILKHFKLYLRPRIDHRQNKIKITNEQHMTCIGACTSLSCLFCFFDGMKSFFNIPVQVWVKSMFLAILTDQKTETGKTSLRPTAGEVRGQSFDVLDLHSH